MFCTNCGTELSDCARFCPVCGMPTQDPSEEATEAIPSPGMAEGEGNRPTLAPEAAEQPAGRATADTLGGQVSKARASSRRKIPLVLMIVLVALAVAATAFAAYLVYDNVIAPAFGLPRIHVTQVQEQEGLPEAQTEGPAQGEPEQAEKVAASYEYTSVVPDTGQNAEVSDRFVFSYPVFTSDEPSPGLDVINAEIAESASNAYEFRTDSLLMQRYSAEVTYLDNDYVSLYIDKSYAIRGSDECHTGGVGVTYRLSDGARVSPAEVLGVQDSDLPSLVKAAAQQCERNNDLSEVTDHAELFVSDFPRASAVTSKDDVTVARQDFRSESYYLVEDGLAYSHSSAFHLTQYTLTFFVRGFDGSSTMKPGDVINLTLSSSLYPSSGQAEAMPAPAETTTWDNTFTGTLRIELARDFIPDPTEFGADPDDMYVVIYASYPQTIYASFASEEGNIRQADAGSICVACTDFGAFGNVSDWMAYDGMTVTIGCNASDTWYSSDVRLPLGTPRADNAVLVSVG